jgi:hypothetical protein
MKVYLFLPFFIYLNSCSQTTQHSELVNPEDESWVISDKTITSNKYNTNGMLDSAFIVTYVYIKGQFLDSMKSIKARKYDHNNNLVSPQCKSWAWVNKIFEYF